jgi:hypothetical protein
MLAPPARLCTFSPACLPACLLSHLPACPPACSPTCLPARLPACLPTRFISRSNHDVEGLAEGMLALLQSLDERLVYGCFTVGWIGWGPGQDWAEQAGQGRAGLGWAAPGRHSQYACHA